MGGTPGRSVRPGRAIVPAVLDLIDRALAEDVGDGDLTTAATVPPDASARARIVQKAEGAVAGLDVAGKVFERVDPALRWPAAWGRPRAARWQRRQRD